MATKKTTKATSTMDQEEPVAVAMYEVLSPFKLRGVVVKPPAWVKLTADDAVLYQAAGVLGTEPGEVSATSSEGGE